MNGNKIAGANPLFSVVILNWGKPRDTEKCIESVRNQTYTNFEIIVVDNGSKDDSKQILEKIDDIKLVLNKKNKGFTGGHIDGLKIAMGEFIVILNNDAVLSEDYFEKSIPLLQSDDSIGALGGRSYIMGDDYKPYDTSNPYYTFQNIDALTGEAIFSPDDLNAVQIVNNVSGSCAIIRKSVIEDIGYLYKPFFAYFEETDFFARMKRAGYKVIYDPGLAIWHEGGASSNEYFQYKQLFRNRFIFAIRNFESNKLPIFLKTYTKIGLRATLARFKSSKNQSLNQAYSNAFLYVAVNWPKYLLSRLLLNKKLGRSNYNSLIKTEQVGVSFVQHVNYQEYGKVREIFERFSSNNVFRPNNELIIVTESKEMLKKIKKDAYKQNHINIKVVLDTGQFDTLSENVGWLSAKNQWIWFGALPKKNIDYLLADVVRNKSLGAYDSKLSTHAALFDRSVLETAGGLKKKTLTKSVSLILAYVKYGSRSLYENSQPFICGEEIKIEALNDFSNDIGLVKPISGLHRLMSKKSRTEQIYTTVKWLFSTKVPIRLKVGRIKNITLGLLLLNKKKISTELKHIRNEKIRYIDRSFVNNISDPEDPNYLLSDWKNIPVFVICRDRVDCIQDLILAFNKFGLKNISFIDNDSKYKRLLEFYDKTGFQVFKTGRNIGHKSPWISGFVKTLAPNQYYIVTDPDVIPIDTCPNDAIGRFLKLHSKYPYHIKVGFGLKIDDLPNHYPHKGSVIAWEKQFWRTQLEKDVYESPLDTTFALYKPRTFNYALHPSIRTGGELVARHLPWYVDGSNISDEEHFYRSRASRNVTSWNVDKLEDRYNKEISKQK